MNNNRGLLPSILKIANGHHKRLWFVCFVYLISGFFEAVAVFSFAPVVYKLIGDTSGKGNYLINILINQSVDRLVIIFVGLNIFANFLRIFVARLSTKTAFMIGSNYSQYLFTNYISTEYEKIIRGEKAYIYTLVNNYILTLINDILYPVLNILSAAVISIFIFAILVILNPISTLISATLFLIIYFITIRSLRKRQKNAGVNVVKLQHNYNDFLTATVNLTPAIILSNSIDTLKYNFSKISDSLRKSQSDIVFLAIAPRFIVEAIGIGMIGAIYFFGKYAAGDMVTYLPFIGVMLVAAQRLLPIFQQIFQSLGFLNASKFVLDPLTAYDDYREVDHSKSNAFKSIHVKNYRFSDTNGDQVLFVENVSFEKGKFYAIFGKSGAGKSVLLKEILGLNKIHNVSVKYFDSIGSEITSKNIRFGYLPEKPYIVSGSIYENLTFPLFNTIRNEDISIALMCACIDHKISSLNLGLNEIIDDSTKHFSTGERQRLCLARELSKFPDVLVIDEGFNFIDTQTASIILSNLRKSYPHMTILCVTHNELVLNYFDFVCQISDSIMKCESKNV